MNAQPQRIIFPWETKRWPELKAKVSEPINSIVDLDSRISSIHGGKVRPRMVIDIFNQYYNDESYARDRVSQDVLIKDIIPMLQKFIVEGPKTFRGFIPRVLVPFTKSKNIALSRPQVITLIACSWFGLFESTYLTRGKYKLDDFPEFSFVNIFTNNNVFALQCILNYFARVHKYTSGEREDLDIFNAGNIIIYRKPLMMVPDWAHCQKPLCEIIIGEDANGGPGKIDDSDAKMHVDFANEFVGGGAFGGILSQEEILFLVRPECLVSMLFCMRLERNESICIFGAEKISQYTGYASNVKFMGDYQDPSPKGYSADCTEVLLQHVVIGIDATPKTSGIAQYIDEFDRDLNKAYCGFSAPPFEGEAIATGNWGCGAFGGNMQLKFLQQVLAASMAGRTLIYYPFIRDFEDKLLPFVDWLQNNRFTVGELYLLYKALMKKCYRGPNSRLSELDLFESLIDM